VAPHRLEIENDEALFGLRAGEQIVAPFTPSGPIRGKRWRCHKRSDGEGDDADEFHGGFPEAVLFSRATQAARAGLNVSPM
jgi:hypothetical protein